jgi:predicted nucleotidyltransferase component of viral defense system
MDSITASVRDQLQTQARQSGRTFNEVLQYYGMERLLFRLSRSEFGRDFVLRGALAFFAWGVVLRRPTRDIDLRGYGRNSIAYAERVFRDVCRLRVEEDGVWFDPRLVMAERIIEDEAYAGIRVHIEGRLGKAQLHLQVNLGFSGELATEPEWLDYPTLLDMAGPRLRVYPLESFVADKFEAMVDLGLANSRLKDFYDVYVVSELFDVEGERMARAIAVAFRSRQTPLPEGVPQGLSVEFAKEKGGLWWQFVQRVGDDEVPIELQEVMERLRGFLLPPAEAARSAAAFGYHWQDGKWKGTGGD